MVTAYPMMTRATTRTFTIKMKVTKKGDSILVDFDGSDPANVKGPMNAALSVTASGVYCGLKTSPSTPIA